MSTAEPVDYAAIIADLEAKKAALETTLASLRSALALGALGQPGDASGAISALMPSVTGGEIPVGAFLGKSIPEAARLCLQIIKRKMTSREIAESLKKGGIESTAKIGFPALVHSILIRASSKPGTGIVKLDRSHWGLAEWYPAAMRGSAATPEKRIRGRRRGRPPKSKATAQAAGTPAQGPKPKERILQVLRNQPGMELSLQELADHLRMSRRSVNMALVNLIHGKAVQKTASGKYRVAA